MAKNSIRDYSATNSSNTDIQSIDISEGCSPAGINNAIREVMADLKDVSTGAVALETPAADSLTVTGITTATGGLNVGTIKDATGTNTAMTIDSSGRVALPNRPYAFVDFGGSAYVSKTGGANLVFDNAIHNDGSHYNTGTGIFTCPVSGLYTVQCCLLSNFTSDTYEVWVQQDGTTIARTLTIGRVVSFSYAIKCTASQTLALALSTTTNIYEGTGTSRYSFAVFTYIG